uniref:Cadherin domain-containing protein n=1 Tax=Astyanax mexicanus TaxID=7994 RepID=A0A3B1JSJ9_ASTMX
KLDRPSYQHGGVRYKYTQLCMNINVLKLWRQKRRCMLIPPLFVPENQNVPFPKLIAVVNFAKENTMIYSMKGEGADEPPVGVFIIDKNNGAIYVTKPLDRETKDKYVLTVHAVAANGEVEEETTEIIIFVIDGNDNKPIFTQNPFLGSVAEASPRGTNATDADDPDSDHADIRYSIISQTPPQPDPNMFIINPITGGIRVNSDELDREVRYILLIQAADMMGDGLVTTGTAVITVTDINDHAPQFEKTLYTASVPENKVGSVVVKIPVTDGDDPQTPAWTANFRIFSGNSGGFFSISTGPNKQEGIITTVKPLDFEQTNKYTLLVITENDVPFAKPLPTSTATVIVNVQDVNEAPVFDPAETIISKPEDLEVGTELTVYTATDPDTARAQTVTYRVSNEDRSGWVSIDRDTGLIRVKSSMDRESPLVKDGKFKVLILAVDDDEVPATGTGTLVIELEDVNDNAPVIEEREITVCSKNSVPVSLSVTDEDGSGFAAPFTVELHEESRNNWTTAIQQGKYSVVLRVYDSSLHSQDSTIITTVCDCTGEDVWCSDREISGFGLSPILGILGASLLSSKLTHLYFKWTKFSSKQTQLSSKLTHLYFKWTKFSSKQTQLSSKLTHLYFKWTKFSSKRTQLSSKLTHLYFKWTKFSSKQTQLSSKLTHLYFKWTKFSSKQTQHSFKWTKFSSKQVLFKTDPNLKAADDDPKAPPYDSLLTLDDRGPRFKKLADVYGGGDEL